jgi:hypothetical protein
MTETETNLTLEQRMERVKAKALASGIKFVSEDELHARQRERRDGKAICRSANVSPPVENYRSPLPPEKDFEPEPAASTKDSSALDFETSANMRLLEFFREPKNFMKWFAAKWLEDEIGRTSGRMNNRAIWLRAQFNTAGLELDQHACPPGENLPNGSYYRMCRIEDALRLSVADKHRLTHPEPEFL